ncbi:MAG: acetyl-CoA hydrolase/transferase C-terminal domain-containing protein [Gemmobacter sp.]|nr:acetyl-CoA hydrolase/transferase C-terminal domain-containing protein [Gemmobacter sp.]
MGLSVVLPFLWHGARVFIPGSAAEFGPLTDYLLSDAVPPLQTTSSLVPGINPVSVWPPRTGTTLASPFPFGAAGAQDTGAMRHMALSYFQFDRDLAAQRFDLCVVQVAPPDAQGRASLGPSVEFTPTVLRGGARIIAVVNPNLPMMRGSAWIRLSDTAVVIDSDAPLRTYEAGAPRVEATAIAKAVAGFIGDGATVQIGIGKVPGAPLRALTDRSGLRLHSGMLSDGMQALTAAGALDPAYQPTSCVHVGSAAHYDWLRGRDGIVVAPVSQTPHAPATLAAQPGLVAVSGALSVDLFGQANLDSIGSRAISGVGGAADFAAAAARGNGVSIVVLPATDPKGSSRITAGQSGPVSLPRHDIDVIVTEYGAADLRGACVMERAERLIAIAAPNHRSALTDQWRDIANRL